MLKAFGCGPKASLLFVGVCCICGDACFVVKRVDFVVVNWVIIVILRWFVVKSEDFVVKVTLDQLMDECKEIGW